MPFSAAHRRTASNQRRGSDMSSSSTTHLVPTTKLAPPPIPIETAESPYPAANNKSFSTTTSVSSKYSLSADPLTWGTNLNPKVVEPDDNLHNPTVGGKVVDDVEMSWSARAFTNLGCLAILCILILALFIGYPALNFQQRPDPTIWPLGVNASGQVPEMPASFSLVDYDTPLDARTKKSRRDGEEWQLVFSDEFNVAGRTF